MHDEKPRQEGTIIEGQYGAFAMMGLYEDEPAAKDTRDDPEALWTLLLKLADELGLDMPDKSPEMLVSYMQTEIRWLQGAGSRGPRGPRRSVER